MTEKHKICNGTTSPRPLYSRQKRAGLIRIINELRISLIYQTGGRDDERGFYTGTRFNNNDSVIARLESANQDEIKSAGWKVAVYDALIDCMETDYYYEFQKTV